MTEKLEEKIKELDEKMKDRNNNSSTNPKWSTKIVDLLSRINQKILDSNGFMTSKGKYICKSEWHAFALGISFPAMAFMLPTPLGEFMIIAMLLMLRTGFKKLGDGLEGHMADVMHELAYMMVSAMLTVAYFTYFTQKKLNEIDVGQAITTMLVGG